MTLHKRIMIIVFAMQLIFTFLLAIIGISNEMGWKNNAQIIKVHVNDIAVYGGTTLNLIILDNEILNGYNNISKGYYCFNKGENDIYKMSYSKRKPKNRLFIIKEQEYCSWFDLKYETQTSEISFLNNNSEFDLPVTISLYSDLEGGYQEAMYFMDLMPFDTRIPITEPPVDAYALMKIYNGKYEFIDLYIDGIQVDEYIDNIATGKVDLTAFREKYESKRAELKSEFYN